jgi:hypothetical protein
VRPKEEPPRCDVRIITRPVGDGGWAFMVRGLFINDREYRIPANAEVLIHAKPRDVSTLTLTLFPTSVQFESEPPPAEAP